MACIAAVLALVISIAPVMAAAAGETITVAGASDLTFAFREIAAGFEEETGTRVILSLGSTGLLARQVEHGAPFDVFFAANVSFIDGLGKKGLVLPDTVVLYAQGRIVLAVNKASGVSAVALEDVKKPGVRRFAIANPDHAPYGTAAREALISAGLWDDVSKKIVYGENVRQTLQFIQTGNAEAGVVALSVAEVPEVSYTRIDPSSHNPINQAAAVLVSSKNPELARMFIDYVNGPKGRPVMKQYGFYLPGEL